MLQPGLNPALGALGILLLAGMTHAKLTSFIPDLTAREEISFPFLTSKVKCGKHGLELADRLNAHSIVNFYRRIDRLIDVHRRVLEFLGFCDDNGVHMYVHHPEVDSDKKTCWRDTLLELTLGKDRGKVIP